MYERKMVYRVFTFFLLQAVAITFEDFVIYVSKTALLRRGIKLNPGNANESWVEAVIRVIGYCWVVLWFCLTLPGYIDGPSAAGLYVADRLTISQFLFDTWEKWA